MNIYIKPSSKITHADIDSYNEVWKSAFRKDRNLLKLGDLNDRDVFFLLTLDDNAISVGRYRYIEGVKIDGVLWHVPLWGRADIAVDPTKQGSGYGKAIVTEMITYGKEHDMSCIGFSGKSTSLPQFYEKCGLQVDYILGEKLYRPVEGELKSLSHVAVSYFEGDSFAHAVRLSEKTVLPYSW